MPKIICLPFAGASKYAYNQFNNMGVGSLDFIGLDLPGRGMRFNEPLLRSIDEMTHDLYNQILPFTNEPYYLFGHSMGAILGQRICEKLHELDKPLPKKLLLSGRGGPDTEITHREWHKLPPNDFKKKVFELGGSPKEVLDNPELMELMEPILRADFEAVETYLYPKINKLDIPVSVYYGSHDKCTKEECENWQVISDKKITLTEISGNHFFIFSNAQQFLNCLKQDIDA
ncbi:thioesterase II family protein [Luteibaculum oceani]|uniref:Thioesterase n=1 Tax=Luteibaculum oceani TaxID=1294296 RepID=A0A5C6VAU0_9FLAO|nr:alpha/beta fold hydrolase [Luteibaculum oceani]TXC81944.1 thioesterase [Luteibaculum oceani]